MKKVLFSFFLIASLIGQAQTNPALPFPVQGTWVYYNVVNDNFWKDENPVPQTVNVSGFSDSLNSYYFDGQPLVCSGMNPPSFFVTHSKTISAVGNKWYYNGQLYVDWEMQEGDTISFTFPQAGDQYLVSNIDTITTPDMVQRRIYHLLALGFGDPYESFQFQVPFFFIEGIGANIYGLDSWDVEDFNILTCFYDENGLEVYKQDYPVLAVYDCCRTVGIEEESISKINLFPSPAKEKVTIQFDGIHVPSSIQIFNSVGQVVHTEAVNRRQQMTLNTESLATGVYIVRAADSSVTATFVKE